MSADLTVVLFSFEHHNISRFYMYHTRGKKEIMPRQYEETELTKPAPGLIKIKLEQ